MTVAAASAAARYIPRRTISCTRTAVTIRSKMYNGGLLATRVALPQRGNVRAEMTHKKGVAEQRNFLCEGGCLLASTPQ
eukprot:COSAG05_NODE_2914_length_2512_cov_10.137588_4_plen_79_part_00